MNSRDDKQLDVRTLERRLRRGIVNKKDFDKHLKALPDVGNKAVPVGVHPPGGRFGVVADDEPLDDDGDE